ncbi:MAG: GNAT family N-acetyltransferase [Actinomycetota bacterium]
MTGSGAVVVGVRPAGPGDQDELASMAAAARQAVETARGGAALLADDPAASNGDVGPPTSSEPQAGVVLIGTIDDVVVGYLVLASKSLADGRRRAVVEELWVEPEARQVGVGAAMLADGLDWAAGQGCTSVDAVALPGDRETKNFFESHGLVARAIIAHRELGPA